jgi:hypothetical protein
MASPPNVDAFLLCEHVHRDAVTGKYTLVGLWDALRSPQFPTLHGEYGLYFNLTGLNGTYRFGVVILGPDLSQVGVRFEVREPVTANDPLRRHELGFNLPGLQLPQPGRYTVRLLYNDLIAADFTLTAIRTS